MAKKANVWERHNIPDGIHDEIKNRQNMGDAWENLLFVSSLIT
jgi:hypothetical protein